MPIRTAVVSDLEAIDRLGYDAWSEGRKLDNDLDACRSPTFHERFGFATIKSALEKRDSILMVRAGPKKLAGLFADSRFKTPAYF